jgi:Trk K+ transport system NAD-binding subunit
MRRSSRRLLILVGTMPVALVVFALLYMLGMEHLEGVPRGFGDSLSWASETMTTTGYGRDAAWSHPWMQALVIVVQFVGVFLTFLVFPVFLIPFFEERFEGRLPTQLPKVHDYVLIYRWGPAVASLTDELERAGVPVVILEQDMAVARRLRERGRQAVFINLDEDDSVLGTLKGARGLVANARDHDNAVFILSARAQGFEGPIVALVENPSRRRPMQRAGASAVFTPQHVLAAAVAAKASAKISPRVSGVQSLGRHLQISEARVQASSELVGKSLAEANVRRRTGATIVGQWVNGTLSASVPLDQPIARGSILIAAGSEQALAKLGELATPMARTGHFVVIGYGEVGHKVAQFLRDSGDEVRVINDQEVEGADIVGDALDAEVLRRAGVAEAQAVILVIGHDSETVFAAAVIRDLTPDTTIVASVKRAETVSRVRRAGADFALSIGEVAGQLLVFQLLGQESVSLQAEIKVVKTQAGDLAGRALLTTRVRERTGCLVVAVERGEQVIVEFGAEFAVRYDDLVYISGTPEAVKTYFDVFPSTRPG